MYFRWLRRLVRRHTNPIPEEKAASTKNKLSILYMLLSWNAFGFVCYMCFTGRSDWARYYGYKSEAEASIPPAQQWANTLKIDKAKIVRISGLNVEYKYDYENKSLKEENGEISKSEEKYEYDYQNESLKEENGEISKSEEK